MKLVNLTKLHEGKYLSYYIADYETKSGHIKKYEFISRNKNLDISTFGKVNPAGVGMVTLSEDGQKILLQSEFRMATNNWVYNFPAGLIDKGEDAVKAAKRELQEETGLEVVDIIDVLPPSFASQGTSDEAMQIVICTCKGDIKESIYEDEEIKARWYTREEVRDLLIKGAYMSVRTQMYLYEWVKDLKPKKIRTHCEGIKKSR